MIRKLCLASVLALASIAPLTARAQDASVASVVESPAVAQAHAQYDASETAYAQAGGANGGGGFAGQLQQLTSAGNTAQASQLVQARADTRSGLESSITTYLGALKSQYDAAQAAGQGDQTAVLARVQGLRSRLQALATDSVNDKLAAIGFGSRATPTAATSTPTASGLAGSTGFGGYGQDTPASAPVSAPAATSAPAALGSPVLAPAPVLDPGPVAASGEAKTQERPAGKPRKATGRLVVVARADSPEATLERLEKALEQLRAGKPLEPGEGDVYLVERWRERTPSWIRLTTDETRAAELVKLKRNPGATCSLAGTTDAAPARGEPVVLRDWKLLALSAGDRLSAAPRTPAAREKTTEEKPLTPGALGAEEENFND